MYTSQLRRRGRGLGDEKFGFQLAFERAGHLLDAGQQVGRLVQRSIAEEEGRGGEWEEGSKRTRGMRDYCRQSLTISYTCRLTPTPRLWVPKERGRVNWRAREWSRDAE